MPVQVERAGGGRRAPGVEEPLRGRDRQPLGHQLRPGHRDGDVGDRFRVVLSTLVYKAIDGVGRGQHDGLCRGRGRSSISPTACSTNGSASAVSATECAAGRAFVRTYSTASSNTPYAMPTATVARYSCRKAVAVSELGAVGYGNDLVRRDLDVGEPSAPAGGRALTESVPVVE